MGSPANPRRPSAEIEVSDHALVRWLERRHGIDMEGFRQQLAAEVRHVAGSGAYSLKTDACTFVFRGDTLVTVLEPRFDPDRRRWLFAQPGVEVRA